MYDYIQAARDAGLDVVAHDMVGDWQGDYVVLVNGPHERGILVMGYGSCSGCDLLEAIGEDKNEYDKYVRSLPQDVVYGSDEALLANWGQPDGTRWFYHDQAIFEAVKKLLNDN